MFTILINLCLKLWWIEIMSLMKIDINRSVTLIYCTYVTHAIRQNHTFLWISHCLETMCILYPAIDK